jgi:hypothetical protein
MALPTPFESGIQTRQERMSCVCGPRIRVTAVSFETITNVVSGYGSQRAQKPPNPSNVQVRGIDTAHRRSQTCLRRSASPQVRARAGRS